ncbi:hypothetical protein C8R21_12518 [Nitrosospira multiformis]|uniref:Exo-alpha-sialidase n=1 Tax=Nitrosospira multiformis TaxID=1231 RepID=A0A2T5I6Y0_9PROT|nr:sialidase family protein [Nitrosospira multiformis]PTQ79583.1 hypothetical protein C8R21_12518 [Nitrosospira multiformis]
MGYVAVLAITFLLNMPLAVFAGSPEQEQGSTKATTRNTIGVGATLDEAGRLWVARVENQQLLVSFSDDDGFTFSAPVTVTREPESIYADGENRPKIAVARDGTVLLTWVQALPQKHSGNIRMARSTDSGRTFSTPITLNDDGRITSHSFGSMAMDGTGRVVVAWLDGRDREAAKERGEDFTGVSVYMAQSSDNGATFGPNRQFRSHTCQCCRIGLTWSNEGPIALWRDIFDSNTRDFAIANLDKGNMRRATDDEWQIDACPHNGGSIAADGVGGLHFVWFTNGNARQGIFYRRLSGDRMSPPLMVGDPAAQANHASVAANGKTVIVTWREFDGRSYSAKMMYSRDGGESWSEVQRMMASAGATDHPIPLIKGEKVTVVWNTASDGLRVLPLQRLASR